MRQILVVRHGETNESRLNVVQGQSDTCLTERGIAQARVLGLYLKSRYTITSITSSDLRRAVQTAEIIASQLDSPALLRETPSLRELSLGHLEGESMRSLAEFRQLDARGTEHSAPVGGETLAELRDRVLGWFRPFAAGVHGCCLVVTHRGPISVLLDSVQPPPLKASYDLALEHGSIAVFGVPEDSQPMLLAVEMAVPTPERR